MTGVRGLARLGLILSLAAALTCLLFRQASAQSGTTPEDRLAGIEARAPDAFYDPPVKLTRRLGILIRSEPLENVTLPAGGAGGRPSLATVIGLASPSIRPSASFPSR
jgi:hypothetical protein